MKKLLLVLTIAGILSSSMAMAAIPDVYGCKNDIWAYNYNSLATIDDGSCKRHGNGDAMKVLQAWGVDGYHTPKVACPTLWKQGCFDISGFAYFASRLNPIGITYQPIITDLKNYSFR